MAKARYKRSNRWLIVAPMRSASNWPSPPVRPRAPSTREEGRRLVVELLKVPPLAGTAPVSKGAAASEGGVADGLSGGVETPPMPPSSAGGEPPRSVAADDRVPATPGVK